MQTEILFDKIMCYPGLTMLFSFKMHIISLSFLLLQVATLQHRVSMLCVRILLISFLNEMAIQQFQMISFLQMEGLKELK